MFLNALSEESGGETGIRTLGGLAPTTVFETAPFDHSGTSPRGSGAVRLIVDFRTCNQISANSQDANENGATMLIDRPIARPMLRFLILFLILPIHVAADEISAEKLIELLRHDELAEVMRLEAMHIESSLPSEFDIEIDTLAWQARLDEIFQADRIEAGLTAGFLATFNTRSMDAVSDYLASDEWVAMFDLTNAASLALLEPEQEAAAKEAYWRHEELQTDRLRQIEDLVNTVDLIEQNVAGWLNSMIAFNTGMGSVDIAFSVPEDEMIAYLLEDEHIARQEIGEWVMAFYWLAMDPVSDASLDRHIEFWQSRAGKDLSVAMMAGYQAVYGVTDFEVGKALVEATLELAL